MSMLDELSFEDIDDLHGYQPAEIQYAKFGVSDPNIVAAGYKVEDVYQTLSRARGLLGYSHSENWGDIALEDCSDNILFAKSQMILSALLLYGIALDMSWQIAWVYALPSSVEFLLERKYIKKYKECTLEKVKYQLKLKMKQNEEGAIVAKKLHDLLVDFVKKPAVASLRSKYNSLKHHGCFHIEGLGSNYSELCFSINGEKIAALNRQSYSIGELEEVLVNYDHAFVPYVRAIISLLFPSDFKENSMNFLDFVGSVMSLKR